MNLLVLVGVGGFIGAVLRFLVGGWLQGGFSVFPVGTLAVNFLGSLALSVVMYASDYLGFLDDKTRVFLTIGVLGSFTTMSTFSYESFRLLEQEELLLFSVNVVGTLLLTFFAIYLGKSIVFNLGGV